MKRKRYPLNGKRAKMRAMVLQLQRMGFRADYPHYKGRAKRGTRKNDATIFYKYEVNNRVLHVQLHGDGNHRVYTSRVTYLAGDRTLRLGERICTAATEFKTMKGMYAAVMHELSRLAPYKDSNVAGLYTLADDGAYELHRLTGEITKIINPEDRTVRLKGVAIV